MLRRLELPVTVLVLNNGILGYQKHAEEVRFGEHTIAVNFAAVDHAAIARACGVEGVRVENGAGIAPGAPRRPGRAASGAARPA